MNAISKCVSEGEDDDCVYVFGTPKAGESFRMVQTVAPHDENKVI